MIPKHFVVRAQQFLRYGIYVLLLGIIGYEAKTLYTASSGLPADAAALDASSSSVKHASNREYVSRIVAAHLFPSPDQSNDSDISASSIPSADMAVLGILYSDVPSLSTVILKINGHEQSYSVGAALPDGEKVEEIAPDHVTLLRGDARFNLPLPIQFASHDARFAEISLTAPDQDRGNPPQAALPSTALPPGPDAKTPVLPTAAKIAADPLLTRKFPSLQTIRRERHSRFEKIPPGGN